MPTALISLLTFLPSLLFLIAIREERSNLQPRLQQVRKLDDPVSTHVPTTRAGLRDFLNVLND